MFSDPEWVASAASFSRVGAAVQRALTCLVALLGSAIAGRG